MSAIPLFGTASTDRALRSCALTLHAIALQDRTWVLSRLTGPRRSELEQLLAELDALGIAPDPLLAQAAMNPRSSRESPRGTGLLPPALRHDCADDDAGQLAAMLSREPASLIAQAIRGRDEAYVASFVACLPPEKREEVATRIRLNGTAVPLPAKLEEALQEELRQRRPSRMLARQGSLAQRWRAGLRRLGGLLA